MPLNILAWNNEIGPWYYFVGLRDIFANDDPKYFAFLKSRAII
jgi:hypothetical protein